MHYVTDAGSAAPDKLPHHPLPPQRLEELEAIEANDNFQSYSKKMESQLRREDGKIKRNLDGIRTMSSCPALVVIDVRREVTALKEAHKLGIPTICLIDTDGDPEYADIPIPGNDDSMRSIDVVIRERARRSPTASRVARSDRQRGRARSLGRVHASSFEAGPVPGGRLGLGGAGGRGRAGRGRGRGARQGRVLSETRFERGAGDTTGR
ncbi:MAG: 30S ribosomal protein S2 [Phycisphaerales bacterium]